MIHEAFGSVRSKLILPLLLIAVVVMASAVAAPRLSAKSDVIEFDDVEFFIEVNSTDEDAGVQLSLDGEQWKSLKIFDPDGQQILNVKAKGSLNIQGLTEFFL